MIQARTDLRQSTRSAIDGNTLPITGGIFARGRHLGEIEIQVVRNEQIQVAIAIVIDPCAAGRIAASIVKQARLFRYVGEGSVSIVAEEDVLPPTGNKKIVESIVVVIAHGHAARPDAAA